MNTESIIKSLNLTDGEILTLEKGKDRLEFEALPVMLMAQKVSPCPSLCPCWSPYSCDLCKEFCFVNSCDCRGPVGYIPFDDCHPYTGCRAKKL